MQALVAGALFETIGDPCTGPSLPGDMHDAGRIGLLEPRRRIKLNRQGTIDRVACGADHWGLPLCSRFGAREFQWQTLVHVAGSEKTVRPRSMYRAVTLGALFVLGLLHSVPAQLDPRRGSHLCYAL